VSENGCELYVEFQKPKVLKKESGKKW
jgi:hypothetical protein